MQPEDMTFELAKAQVSAASGVPPPSNFGLKARIDSVARQRTQRPVSYLRARQGGGQARQYLEEVAAKTAAARQARGL